MLHYSQWFDDIASSKLYRTKPPCQDQLFNVHILNFSVTIFLISVKQGITAD